MIDEIELNNRKSAYIDTVRNLHRNKRQLGFIACLVGVILMFAARMRPELPDELVWAGVAIVAAGWGLFAFVVYSRMTYVRTHPFDPGT
jgi:hypothetical protein